MSASAPFNLFSARNIQGTHCLKIGKVYLKVFLTFPHKTVKLCSLPSPVVRARDPDGDEVPASLELICWAGGWVGTVAPGVVSIVGGQG